MNEVARTEDEMFKPTELLDEGQICARVCAAGAYLDIHDADDSIMISSPTEARALRDWLNKVLP